MIPKRILYMLEQRKLAAEKFNKWDYELSQWCHEQGIADGVEVINSHVHAIVNPQDGYDDTVEDIIKALKAKSTGDL